MIIINIKNKLMVCDYNAIKHGVLVNSAMQNNIFPVSSKCISILTYFTIKEIKLYVIL